MTADNKHNDVKFFLIAIAFISAFNYYLTWSNIHFNWFLLMTYAIDTVQGWLAWWAMRSIIIFLDKKIPYSPQPLKRILIQLIVTTAAGLFVIIVLTELVSWIVRGRPALLNFYQFDIFIFIIWFIVINAIYIGMHYYNELKQSEHHRVEEKKLRQEGFPVKHGKQNLLIPFQDVAGFYVEDGYTVLQTSENKKYLLDKSLDKIEATLPAEWFFRLNRQYILHRKVLTGFKRREEGKIDVFVNSENFPKDIQVSRTKAVGFKKWFQPGEF